MNISSQPCVHGRSCRRMAGLESGFSLLEIAIVMVVIGLILGGILIPLSSQFEKQDRDKTALTLPEIQKAVVGYALANGRLPCPDADGDGTEDLAVTCTTVEGSVPWVDLGVGRLDAWGQEFTYRVTGNFADTVDGTGCGVPTAGVSFELCSNGDISVMDAAGGAAVANGVPAIIVSHAKNWATTTSVDEAENTDNDVNFVDRAYSASVAPTFDDLITWVSPNVLKSHMVEAGLLP